MSLAVLAQDLASKGRNGDTMLVHMAPSEVAGLHALAVVHGGRLTINPETGLPEANFLKSILPMIAGFALDAVVPGLGTAIGSTLGVSSAAGAAIAVGGAMGLATGSLKQGIMAGLGAYGGANLGAGFMGAGEGAIGAQALASEAGREAVASKIMEQGLTEEAARAAVAKEAVGGAGFFDKLAAGGKEVFAPGGIKALQAGMPEGSFSPTTLAMMAAAPIMAGAMTPTTVQMPSLQRSAGFYRPSGGFDPYGGTFLPAPAPIPVRAKSGGIVALADGGFTDDQVASAIRTSLQQGFDPQQTLAKAATLGATQDQLQRSLTALQQSGYSGLTMPTFPSATPFAAPAAQETYSAPDARQTAIDKLNAELAASGATDPRTARWAGSGQYSVLGVPQSAEVYSASDPNFAYRIQESLSAPDQTAYWQQYARQRETGMDIPLNYQQVGAVGGIPLRTGTGPAESGYVWMGNRPISDLSELQAATQKFGLSPEETMQATRLISEQSKNQAIGGDLYSPIFKAVRDSLQAGYTLDQVYEGAQKNFGLTKADVDNALRYNNVNPARLSPLSGEQVISAAREGLGAVAAPFTPTSTPAAGLAALATPVETPVETPAVTPVEERAADDARRTINAVTNYVDPTQRATPTAAQLAAQQSIVKDPVAAAISAARSGIAAGMTDQQIADMVNMQYGKSFSAQNVADFMKAQGITRPASTVVKDDKVVTTPVVTPVVTPDTTSRDSVTYGGDTVIPTYTPITTRPTYGEPFKPTVQTMEQVRSGYEQGGGSTTMPTIGDISSAERIYTQNRVYQALTDYLRNNPNAIYGDVAKLAKELGVPQQQLRAAVNEYRFNSLTGGSKSAYDYLMGRGAYPVKPFTPTGEIMRPYAEAVLGAPENIKAKRYIFDQATQKYKLNPDYVPFVSAASKAASETASTGGSGDLVMWTNASTGETKYAAVDDPKYINDPAWKVVHNAAHGGLMDVATAAAAHGGQIDRYNLGSYSDGGRLLCGPGDGVSDSIPATIGNRQPARLADGEFVVPARIVSEIGNGSTEAGARKLYAMMDRVQRARAKTTGKGRVAKDTKAEKYLPA